jgi:transcriptional regulator with XRE-family HTH domain
MAISERIRFIRNLRGMTQKYLGTVVGLPEKTADIRMAQYETGTRTPKADLTEALANALGVSPLALEVPNIDSYLGVIHTLFALEDLYGLTVDNKDGEVAFRIDPRKGKDAANILEMIRPWALLAEKYRAGEITKDDYDKWRYNYPQYDAAEIWAHASTLWDGSVEWRSMPADMCHPQPLRNPPDCLRFDRQCCSNRNHIFLRCSLWLSRIVERIDR